jgi:hypothetical protein
MLVAGLEAWVESAAGRFDLIGHRMTRRGGLVPAVRAASALIHSA